MRGWENHYTFNVGKTKTLPDPMASNPSQAGLEAGQQAFHLSKPWTGGGGSVRNFLGVNSPFLAALVLFENQPFPQGFWWLCTNLVFLNAGVRKCIFFLWWLYR